MCSTHTFPPASLFLLLALLALSPLRALAQEESGDDPQPADPVDDWEALIAETEDFLDWDLDPQAEREALPRVQAFWFAGLRIGSGHTSNFLKRPDAAESRFLTLEGDLFFHAILPASTFNALLFFEAQIYDTDDPVDSEGMAFFQANWALDRGDWHHGLTVDAFYGNQIYDASLSLVSAPLGARLQQVRPKLSLFSEIDLGKQDVLGARISLERAAYETEEDDYWRPEVGLEWKRAWITSLISTTQLGLFAEIYDEELARQASSLPLLPQQTLTIQGIRLQQHLSWKPARWPAFEAGARYGLTFEEGTAGDYDAALNLWGNLTASLDLPWFELKTSARWQNRRYQDRTSSYVDDRPLHQVYRSLSVELSRTLLWETSLNLSAEWNTFDSRNPDEAYSERIIKGFLEWSY